MPNLLDLLPPELIPFITKYLPIQDLKNCCSLNDTASESSSSSSSGSDSESSSYEVTTNDKDFTVDVVKVKKRD